MREAVNRRTSNAAAAAANPDPGVPLASFDEEDAQRVPVATAASTVVAPATVVVVPAAAANPSPARAPLKRPLTLDLNAKPSPEGGAKRLRFNSSVNVAPISVLNSPDLQMLKMASPELEKFMMANPSLQTPTPSLVYPSKVS